MIFGVVMAQLCVPLAKGFEEIEAISIIDICRRGDIEVITAGVDTINVIGAHDIEIVCDCLIDQIDAQNLDMIALPGGWGGTEVLASNQNVQALLKKMKNNDKHIGAICAAPYALNSAGVLSENFTCYPSIEQKIRTEGYEPNQAIVIDGKVMTSQGVGTAICFALEIVKTLKGDQTYQTIKSQILASC